MTATTRIRLGDMFHGASDLIVLPCSTTGTITQFVARRLRDYAIPHPRPGMPLGAVDIMPFQGAEHLAQYVAFAASVEGMNSRADAIERIGAALGEFTMRCPSVRTIAAPLLGAGAGGVRSETVVESLKRGFVRTAHSGSSMVIHVLHQDVFDRLGAKRRYDSDTRQRSVRVFISHTAGTEESAQWVIDLARYLMGRGIEARVDQLHLRRGMDLPQWMCNELSLADKVLIVCDESYKMKADGRLGGVGWETMIIQGDLANLPPDSTKYQIVVREDVLADGLPMYLKTRYAFHAPPSVDDEAFRAELMRELLDITVGERPDDVLV